jgi:putative aldouronate transport system substrate-binding protein
MNTRDTSKWNKPLLPAVSMMLISSLLISACSSAGTASNQAKTTETKAASSNAGKPTEIKIMVDYTMPQPPASGNPVWTEFEKRTNTKLNIQWILGANYNDRLNVALAAGDIADLVKIPGPTNALFRQMVKQGAFWDLTPYVKNYPNLKSIDQRIWDNTSIDNKYYAVPSARPLDGGAYFDIRKDWLDKLGLKMPETMDDLYKVMKAFKDNKPDGKPDTIGYTMRLNNLVEEVFTGTVGKWKVKDGKLVEMNLEPEMKEALAYQRKLYDEGLIPKDFPVLKENQFWDLASSGRAGVTAATPEGLFRWTMDQWKHDPKVNWTPIVGLSPKTGDKPFAPQGIGFNGILAIPKSVPEEKMKAILAFIDYGSGGDGLDLTLYGIKGVHYNINDGFKIATAKAATDSVGTGSWGKMFSTPVDDLWQFAAGMPKNVYERNMNYAKAQAKISVPNPTVGLVSETEVKLGADYDKKIDDFKTQVVIGKATMEDWDHFVDQLKKDANYQKIISEMNAAYQAKVSKK